MRDEGAVPYASPDKTRYAIPRIGGRFDAVPLYGVWPPYERPPQEPGR